MKLKLFPMILAALLVLVAGWAVAGAMRLFTPTSAAGLALSPLAPVGSGFLHQGRLTDGGVPANGNYDFVFTLSGSVEGSSAITLTNQLVDNGLFTVSLDFGDEFYEGHLLTLATKARVAGVGSYTSLGSQTLRPVPYALGNKWFGTTDKPAPYDPVRSVNSTSIVSGFIALSDPSAMTIGSDELPLVAYYGVDSVEGVSVAHCDDLECTGFTSTQIFTGTHSGAKLDMTVGIDGFALVVGVGTSNDLKVAHCSNVLCTSATVTLLDADGINPSVTVGADGRGLISYDGGSSFTDLKVAHCSNTNCTSATITTLDNPSGGPGLAPAITIGADGFGLISYGSLNVAHCSNANCTSATITNLGSTCGNGSNRSITTGADGLGLISCYGTGTSLNVAHCDDPICTGATITTLDSTGDVGGYSSITTGPNGLGLISYFDRTNFDLKLAMCKNAACTGAALAVLNNNVGDVLVYPDISWGIDGLPVISYYASAFPDGSQIRFMHCGSPICANYAHAR